MLDACFVVATCKRIEGSSGLEYVGFFYDAQSGAQIRLDLLLSGFLAAVWSISQPKPDRSRILYVGLSCLSECRLKIK